AGLRGPSAGLVYRLEHDQPPFSKGATMAGALRKTMLYLGLSEAEQEERENLDNSGVMETDYIDEANYEDDYRHGESAEVTPLPTARAHSSLRRITTVHPRTYNDAKLIGEAFRAGTPVIMNLTDMGDADAKRLVDFSAGLVLGLRAAIERVTNKVFLLSPATVEVASEETTPAQQQARFFNQSSTACRSCSASPTSWCCSSCSRCSGDSSSTGSRCSRGTGSP